MEEEDVRGDRGLSVFRLRAVSRLTLVVRCTEICYSVSTQVLGFRFGCGWCCVVGFLFGCVSAWWNRGILEEVTKASYGRAVTGTAVMARSANDKKKKKLSCKNLVRGRPRLKTTNLTILSCRIFCPWQAQFVLSRPSLKIRNFTTWGLEFFFRGRPILKTTNLTILSCKIRGTPS